MFSNIGGKIKVLAVVTTILGIFLSVVSGMRLMDYNEEAGLISIIVGSLFSWIFSFFTYGFGEMISHLKRSNELSEQILYKINASSAPVTNYSNPTMPPYTVANTVANAAPSTIQNPASEWTCSCGTVNSAEANFCKFCRNQKNQ